MLESCLFQPTEMEVADLLDSQGISGDNAQLLAAVGVETLVGLSQSDPGGLLEELETANSHLGLVEQLPNLDQVVTWIEEARNRLGEEDSTPVTRLDEVVELIPISVSYTHLTLPTSDLV